jgi:hypothetical protein
MANGLSDLTARNQEAAKTFASGGTPKRSKEPMGNRRQALKESMVNRRQALKQRVTPKPVEPPKPMARLMDMGRKAALSRAIQRPEAQPMTIQRPVQTVEPVAAPQVQTISPIELMNTGDAIPVGATTEVINTEDAIPVGVGVTRPVAASKELPKMSARQINLPRLTTSRRQ